MTQLKRDNYHRRQGIHKTTARNNIPGGAGPKSQIISEKRLLRNDPGGKCQNAQAKNGGEGFFDGAVGRVKCLWSFGVTGGLGIFLPAREECLVVMLGSPSTKEDFHDDSLMAKRQDLTPRGKTNGVAGSGEGWFEKL